MTANLSNRASLIGSLNLGTPLDYFAVSQAVQELRPGTARPLLETLAEEIARCCLGAFHSPCGNRLLKYILPTRVRRGSCAGKVQIKRSVPGFFMRARRQTRISLLDAVFLRRTPPVSSITADGHVARRSRNRSGPKERKHKVLAVSDEKNASIGKTTPLRSLPPSQAHGSSRGRSDMFPLGLAQKLAAKGSVRAKRMFFAELERRPPGIDAEAARLQSQSRMARGSRC